MPKRAEKEEGGNGRRGLTISYQALGAILTILAIVGTVWKSIDHFASKEDIAVLSEAIKTDGARIRDLERNWDRYFGATAAGVKPSKTAQNGGRFILASLAEAAEQRPRPVVVTREFIDVYRLQPSKGGSYTVLGEDGNFYSIDEVIAILVGAHIVREKELLKKQMLMRK